MANTQPDVKEIVAKAASANVAHENNLRTIVTIVFIGIYLIFVLTIVGFWVYDLLYPVNGRTQEIKDMILTIYGILSGPLGLIIGYYFGSEKRKP